MNMKVTLIPKNSTPDMKRMAARVIDGNLIQATSPNGRRQDAIAIYNRMMGIKSTTHDYETIDTSEPPYEPPPPPVSEAGLYEKRQQQKQLGGMASILAEAVAVGVAKALAMQQQSPVTFTAPSTVETAAGESMKSPSKRPSL